jgi:glycosyltransferase involved in cell wall biosynthesis
MSNSATTSALNGGVIRTLLPMGCDGVGPSQTCLNLMRGAYRADYPVQIYANRCRLLGPGVPIIVSAPAPLNRLPYKWIDKTASHRIEQMFLEAVQPDDIAYLWPAASLDTHRILKDRGIPIVLEGINTRMASARQILDAAYANFGCPPSHGITDARIADEDAKYACADAIFAPNRHVAAALQGSPLQDCAIPTSYGVDTTKASPPRDYKNKTSLTFLFCGYACVRKGVHLLLDAWKTMPKTHKLQLVGRIEPAIAERYRDLLASDQIEVVGFVDDVHSWFARADIFVFPSLEEGGPQVVYEAALHGLPMVVSPMGAGRMEGIDDALICVDPTLPAAFADALGRVADSVSLRETLGRTARSAVIQFDWNRVGADRAEKIFNYFAQARTGA